MTQSAFFDAVERAGQLLRSGGRLADAKAFEQTLKSITQRARMFLRGDRASHVVPARTTAQLRLLEAEAEGAKMLDPVPDLYRLIAGKASAATTAFGEMTVRGVARILTQLHSTPEWGLLSVRTWTEVSSVALVAVMNASAKAVNKMAKGFLPSEKSLRGTQAVINGLLREVRGRNLAGIRTLVQGLRRRAFAQGLELIDSAELGAVRLWSSDRWLRLGTDRLVGIGKRYPVPVLLKPGTAGESAIPIVGKMKVDLAVEVKSVTGQVEGTEQLAKLESRATSATGGDTIAEIGGEFWHIEYVPKDVVHVVVAPVEGLKDAASWTEQARLAVAELNKRGVPTLVLTFPKKIDDEVQACSDKLMDLTVSIASRVLNAK